MTIATVSVADELAFSALPEDVQELAKRVLGYEGPNAVRSYQQGWGDAVEAMTWDRPAAPSEAQIRQRLGG